MKKEWIIGVLIILIAILIFYIAFPKSSIPSEDNFCLMGLKTSTQYPTSDIFDIKVYLSDLDKLTANGTSGNIDSLIEGYNQNLNYICEKNRPNASVCFISEVYLASNQFTSYGVATNSINYPEGSTNRYINSLTIKCTCFTDSKITLKSQLGVTNLN